MKAPTNENAGLAPGALDTTSTTTHAEPQYSAGVGARKAVAVWLYQIGACREAETRAKFNAHPGWRGA